MTTGTDSMTQEVTQADRDLYADLFNMRGYSVEAAQIREGLWDEDMGLHLIARHRLSHTEGQGDVAAVLSKCAETFRFYERSHATKARAAEENDEANARAEKAQRNREMAEMCEAALTNTQTSALRDVIAERQRQVSEEGWTPEHDDEHDAGQMAVAAGCYALASFLNTRHSLNQIASRYWPWDWRWWKPKGQREDLIRAGALILAEIERIDRKATLTLTSTGEEG